MSKKRVVGIYGSPRPGGNSDALLDAALEGARSGGARVDGIYVRDLKMEGCRECGKCDRTGKCVVKDEMQKVYPLLLKASAVFLGSPVFFYGFPAGLKALIDRAQALWVRKNLARGREPGATKAKMKNSDLNTPSPQLLAPSSKTGYLLAVGATRGKNLFSGMERTARYFFDTLGFSYEGGVMIREAEDKDAVKKSPAWLDQAFQLGKRAAMGKEKVKSESSKGEAGRPGSWDTR
ncbi:MAG: flavodoxin family protein [Proteobacteria bacterium]|nr:flavodoxin family protein [Pseudomonadota bacterium]